MTKEINQALYDALMALFNAHINNVPTGEPAIQFTEKDYSYVNDALDEIDVLYFGNGPDGDNQDRILAALENDPSMKMTDEDAYQALLDRFNNTTVWHPVMHGQEARDTLTQIIETWDRCSYHAPHTVGYFYRSNLQKWISFDNLIGECYTKEFDDEDSCLSHCIASRKFHQKNHK